MLDDNIIFSTKKICLIIHISFKKKSQIMLDNNTNFSYFHCWSQTFWSHSIYCTFKWQSYLHLHSEFDKGILNMKWFDCTLLASSKFPTLKSKVWITSVEEFVNKSIKLRWYLVNVNQVDWVRRQWFTYLPQLWLPAGWNPFRWHHKLQPVSCRAPAELV